jgi:hypothetical protein
LTSPEMRPVPDWAAAVAAERKTARTRSHETRERRIGNLLCEDDYAPNHLAVDDAVCKSL